MRICFPNDNFPSCKGGRGGGGSGVGVGGGGGGGVGVGVGVGVGGGGGGGVGGGFFIIRQQKHLFKGLYLLNHFPTRQGQLMLKKLILCHYLLHPNRFSGFPMMHPTSPTPVQVPLFHRAL